MMSCVLSGCDGEQVQKGTLGFFVCSPWPGLNTGWIQGASGGSYRCLWQQEQGQGHHVDPCPAVLLWLFWD